MGVLGDHVYGRQRSSLFGFFSSWRRYHTTSPRPPRISAMASTSERQKKRDTVLSTFDADIQLLNHARETRDLPQAQDAFDSAGALLTTIKVRSLLFRRDGLRAHVTQDDMVGEREYVDLGRSCAAVCKALDRGLEGRQSDELSPSVLEAIKELTT